MKHKKEVTHKSGDKTIIAVAFFKQTTNCIKHSLHSVRIVINQKFATSFSNQKTIDSFVMPLK